MPVPLHKFVIIISLLVPLVFGLGYWLGRSDERLEGIRANCEEIARRLGYGGNKK